MFEEFCRKTGTIRIPTGTYSDSKPVFEEHKVTYFSLDSNFRDDKGVLQSETAYYLKGYESPIPADSVFIDESGETFDFKRRRRQKKHRNLSLKEFLRFARFRGRKRDPACGPPGFRPAV